VLAHAANALADALPGGPVKELREPVHNQELGALVVPEDSTRARTPPGSALDAAWYDPRRILQGGRAVPRDERNASM